MARRRVVSLLAGGLLALAAALLATTGVLATDPAVKPTGNDVTICHATDADAHPYHMETVDIGSAGYPDGTNGHAGHTGPIWQAGDQAAHIKWGDIIPSYTYGDFTFAGLNATDGQALLDAGCVVPGEAPLPTASPSQCVIADVVPGVAEITPCPTAFESFQGETATPTVAPTVASTVDPTDAPTDTPFESFQGETATAQASKTPPTTSTSNGGPGGSSTPLFALLICLAFGGLGLTAVEAQRRTVGR